MASNNYIDQYTKVFLSCYTGSLYDECGNKWTSTGTLSIGYPIPYSGADPDTTFPTALYFGKGTATLASALNVANKDVTIDFWYYRGDGHNVNQVKKLISFNEGRYFEFTGSPKTHNVWVNNGSRGTYLYIDYWEWYHIAYVFSKSANTWYIFLNGKKQGTITSVYNVTSIQPAIGTSNIYIKNLRVSVGIARWTSNFTPDNKMYLPPPVKANKNFALARYLSGSVTAIFNIYRVPGFESIDKYNTERNIYKNYINDTKRIVLVAPKLPIEYDLKRKIVIGGINTFGPNGLPLFNNDTKRKFLLSSTSNEPLLKSDTKRKIIYNIGNEPLLKNDTKRKVVYNIDNEPLLKNDTKRIVLLGNTEKIPLLRNDTKRVLSSYIPLIKYNLKRMVVNSVNKIMYTVKIEKITIKLNTETERTVTSYKKIPWSFIFDPNYQLKKKGT